MQYGYRLTWLAAMVLCAGCNSDLRSVGLQGEVSYNGRAVERGTIDFLPIDGTVGPSAGAPIDGGRYEIPNKGGLLADGTYQVRIVGLRRTGRTEYNRLAPGGKPVELEENFIPPAYNVDSTLKLRISDVPDKNGVDFRLQASGVTLP
jgi:hypothetical protein